MSCGEYEGTLVWRAEESLKQLWFALGLLAAFFGTGAFCVAYGLSRSTGGAVLAAIGTVIVTVLYGLRDIRGGFYLEIYDRAVVYNRGHARRAFAHEDVVQYVDAYEMCYNVYLTSGKHMRLPMSNRLYFQGYMMLYERDPAKFRVKPQEH